MERLKPVEHGFKAFFFSLTRAMLKRKQREFQPLDGNALTKVLFLRPEKIGDMVISLPVFDGLKAHYPHIKISILASPRNEELIRDDPRFDRIFLYRKRPVQDVREVMAMRRERFDCVVDMICDDSVTALYLSQMCAPGKPRIGVGKVKFREFYDFNYDHRMGNTGHIIQNTLKLLDAFGIDSGSATCYSRPYISREADERIDAFLRQLPQDGPGALKVGYNLSAGSPTRLWDLDKAAALLRQIQDRYPGSQIVLISVKSDRPRSEVLATQLAGTVSEVPLGLSLMEVSSLLGKLDVLISPDTSLVHIARSFNVPVVGLYSRFMKNFLLWRPFGQEIGAVVSSNDGNIHDISVDQVFDMFVRVVDTRKPVVK